MDKQSIIGFVLIGIVLVVWMWLQAPQAPPPRSPSADSVRTSQATPKDTLKDERKQITQSIQRTQPPGTSPDSLGQFFTNRLSGSEKILTVKTALYTAEITTRGGLIKKWELHDYLTWDSQPVELVDYDRGGDFSLLFTSSDGKLINTRWLYFDAEFSPWRIVQLEGDQSYTVELVLPVDRNRRLIKRLTFRNGSYAFDAEVIFVNLDKVVSNYEYQIVWESGLRYAEHNSVDESNYAMAYTYSGGELTELDATHPGEPIKRDINGATGWVAARTKYFALALLAEEGKTQGAYMEGLRTPLPDHGEKESYSLALKMPLRGAPEEHAKVTVFIGPLDFDILKGFHRGLDQMMSLGAAWIIRPISEYVMIPLFQFLRMLIPNYGLVIIVFSIIIKIALHPLTRTSMRSMKRMQALTPLMNEIREKYKDDPQKMNQQVMNLYKEYGVNPAAGCLPLLLQMPILFALYAVFRSSIELRQASFFWWIRDLSIPDTIAKLPFTIPVVGITEISGLAVAMGVTMFIQQKMTVTDPRQKTMVWMMPILMTLLFNSLPSGLNLYYFVFNLLSIGQQFWVNKRHAEEPLRKVERKKGSGGIMGRLTKDLPKLKQ
jgi:YidC/Oxa1 family membrane protein insertase